MNKGKKQKRRQEEITEVLLDLEKDLSNFKLSTDRNDKTIKQILERSRREVEKD